MSVSSGPAHLPDPSVYRVPDGVAPSSAGSRFSLTTPQGGRVVIDRILLQVWQQADGRPRQAVLAHFEQQGLPARDVSAAVACLTRAGLLSLQDAPASAEPSAAASYPGGSLISALIVGYNSLAWLPACLASLRAQSHFPVEIILVDNGSSDGSADWLAAHQPDVTLLRLEQPVSLAAAINLGIRSARGEYILLLNPDVWLEPHALSHLVEAAQSDASCAAVAAKLRLLWAPAFLNGLGNLVGALSWGTDIALGHLDLGQFDDWTELPSACFATALLPAKALQQVGPLDDGFPMYYEDSEWCYRARMLGYTVRLAPLAVAHHAFSGRPPGAAERDLSAIKLQRVVCGRLRFITRLLGPGYLLRFLIGYGLEDLLGALSFLIRRRWGHLRAYLRAWRDYFGSLHDLRFQRKALQSRRQRADWELFRLQRRTPPPLIWRGLPLLTWDIVRHEYRPWIETGQPSRSKMTLPRAFSIWRVEGFAALVHRLGRGLLWKWMQP